MSSVTVEEEEPISEEPEGLAAYEDYLDLIQAIEAAMYDHSLIDDNPNLYYEYSGTERNYICSFEFFGHLYDGSDDIAYQNLGFLIKDIDGDGVKELLLGENDTHPVKNYDGVIYDLYTYENGQIKHIFSGWPRRKYYLTENNEFVCEWASSADEYGKIFYRYENGNLLEIEKPDSEPSYVFPEFNLIGPVWNPVGDLGGDARNDYAILNKKDGEYRLFSLYIAGEGTVYELEDSLPIDVGELFTSVDLDRDGEKEIVVTVLPNVNSASLTEFAVIKKEGGRWKELEGFNDGRVEQGDYYSFPLIMVHDEGFKINLSCEGLDKIITFDVEENYNVMVEQAADQWSTQAEKNAKAYYEKEILSSTPGTPVGYISPFGVWDVKLGEYEGYPCLVALQGVEGPYKFDLWGRVEIYFDYDISGNMRLLDLKFDKSEPEIKPVPLKERLLVAPAGEDVEPEIADVLYDNATFTVFEDHGTETDDPNAPLIFVSKEFTLKDYDYLKFYSDDLDGEYDPIDIYFKGFSIIDIDGDGLNELVYYVNADKGDTGHFMVFSVVDKEVCAYIVSFRNMGTLKVDGTMNSSDAADIGDIWTIAKFTKEGYVRKVLATLRGEEYRIGEREVSWDEWHDYITNEISTKGVLWTATEDVDPWLNYYSR
ncbi:MAG: hypothetical protein J6U67_06200 [Lachnospiraceae bacterium]|nr:hypothetical protein [Lachnospiraceae bacterium]